MCLYPKIIKNKRYEPNKKNGGIVPAVFDIRVLVTPYSCGVCIECKKKKAREWQIRLYEDIKTHKNGKMVTLTFSNESFAEIAKETEMKGYELDNYVATRAVHLFRERWRKQFKKSPRHWLITELGHEGTENIHLHGIIWTDETFDTIRQIWNYGWIYPRYKWQEARNYVSNRTINYCVKYIHKMDKIHQKYNPITLCSPGIGQSYIKTPIWQIKCLQEYVHRNKKGQWTTKYATCKTKTYYKHNRSTQFNKFKGEETNETYKTPTGHDISLTTYWKQQLYTDDQREDLWIQKLNKNERWICGEKVDISKGEEEYYKLLEYYQQLNTKLGYRKGTYSKEEWNRKIYEQERRVLIQDKRINNNKNKNK